MAENSDISWTQHTFNPWWGCTAINGINGEPSACDGCYAETFARRVGFSETGSKFPIWGASTPRRFFGDKHWNEPLKWNRRAEERESAEFVFCGSMCDWAEGRPDQKDYLDRLWKLQDQTNWLIYLMLTKRPQLINKLSPKREKWNRWYGTTAETQKTLDLRWEYLKSTHSPVYWLSMEPLFERVTLPADFLELGDGAWVIVGGESGHRVRPMNPDWVRSLRDQCLEAGVPFHFKQGSQDWGKGFNDLGSDCIPEDLKIRQSPKVVHA